jgi:RNA polymerase sigma factor (sigma-70 family)
MSLGSDLTELARLAGEGDTQALAELSERLLPLVVRTTRLVVGSSSWAAEDAAQEAMVDVMRGIGNVHDPSAVVAWAMRIAVRRALKTVRGERLRWLRQFEAGPPSPDPDDGALVALHRAFYRLPPRLRAIAILRLYVGLSEREAAGVLGCSLGTVKSGLHEARERLSHSLGTAGFQPSTQRPQARQGIGGD